MKRNLGKISVISIIAMLIFSFMTVLPVFADTQLARIFMTPSVNPPAPGPYVCFRWNLTFWVENVTGLWAFQVFLDLTACDEYLNVTGAWLPTWDADWVFKNRGTVMPEPAIYDKDKDGNNDQAKVGDTIMVGTAVNVPLGSPKKLAIIELHIKKAPEKYQTINCVLNIDNADTYLLDELLHDIPATKENGSYTWAWTPPPPAQFAVYNPLRAWPSTDGFTAPTPTTFKFDRYHVWNSTDFDVEIYLRDYNELWGITAGGFVLKFNTTLIKPLGLIPCYTYVSGVDPMPDNVTIPAPWTTWTIHYEPALPWDKLTITVDTPVPAPPTGDLLIAIITFHIEYQSPEWTTAHPEETSPLDIQDDWAEDHIGPIDLDPPVDGLVIIEEKLIAAYPWFEVQPKDTVMGPDLVICEQYGKEFKINVVLKELHFMWKMIGFDIRLCYCPDLMEVVNVEEGPFLKDPKWNKYGTFPIVMYPEPSTPFMYPPCTHIILADLLLPDGTGNWTMTYDRATTPQGLSLIHISEPTRPY